MYRVCFSGLANFRTSSSSAHKVSSIRRQGNASSYGALECLNCDRTHCVCFLFFLIDQTDGGCLFVSSLDHDCQFCVQVEKLQSKWIGDILVKAFNTKWEDLEGPIQTFLPVDLRLQSVVLNARVADALDCIRNLIHGVDVSQNLDRVSDVLCSSIMAEQCRPLVKFPTMTQFKRLQQKCHECMAAEKFDEETQGKANQVTSMTADVGKVIKEKSHVSQCQAVDELFEFIQLLHDFKMAYTSLPSIATSAHAPVRLAALACFDDALSLMDNKTSRILSFQCDCICMAHNDWQWDCNGD